MGVARVMHTTCNILSPLEAVNKVTDLPEGSAAVTPRPEGEGAAASALPCLKNNNCDSDYLGSEEHLRKLRLSVLKQGYSLTLNVEEFFDTVGVERVGFLTLTTPDHLSYWNKAGWDEASKRYHNFMRRVLPSIFGDGFKWVKVMEPTIKGRIHFHLLVDCGEDIRTGVNWDAFAKGDYRSAPKALRKAWAILRERSSAYGMGRCELLPIRTNVEACKRYVGKYLNKGLVQEWGVNWTDTNKKRPAHSRRISYSQGWRVARSTFAWVDKGREWRKAVAYVASVMGFTHPSEFVSQWGEKWAYHHGSAIMDIYKNHERETNESGACGTPDDDRLCSLPSLRGSVDGRRLAAREQVPEEVRRGGDGSHREGRPTGSDDVQPICEERVMRRGYSDGNVPSVHTSSSGAIRPTIGNNMQGLKLHPNTLATLREFGGKVVWVKHKRRRSSQSPD